MIAALVILIVVLLAFSAAMATNVARLRRARRQQGLSKPWKIRRVKLQEFDPVFAHGPFGPTLDTEVHFVGGQGQGVRGGTSDLEAWVLAVLAKRAKLLFEFGTATGKTTYLWARNAPEDARIVTITLAPDEHADYAAVAGDDPVAAQVALKESAFTQFLYTGTSVARNIEQLFGDSKQFDESPYVGRCDLIFIDGSHAYSYVLSDTEKALRMAKPGSIILWHDYAGPDHAPDVARALDELSETLPLVHLAGTTLVALRAT